MPEITNVTEFISSTPEEAADNIDKASIFNIGADVFKEKKQYLQPEVDKLSRASQATDTVANYMKTSPEHAALAAPDVDILSKAEKMWKFTVDQVTGVRDRNTKLVDLNMKKMFSADEFTEEDELEIFKLNED